MMNFSIHNTYMGLHPFMDLLLLDPFTIGVTKNWKKTFFMLLFPNNIYMKKIEVRKLE
jgi:hypothetical protein